MRGARAARVRRGALGRLALCCALGSTACASQQSGQRSALAEPTDLDVETIATRVPPERVPRVTSQSPSLGPASALVTLQLFSDFECSFCVSVAPELADVEARFHGRVRLIWRNYPLPFHPRARPAARAALCAFELGGSSGFWKLHDFLYSARADLSDAGLTRALTELALDARCADPTFHAPHYDAQIKADMAAGDAAGIEGTPAVFINDYYVMGARSAAEYAVVVQRALRDAG